MSSDLSFVVCIESGILEAMTLRLLKSLRRNGGGFRDCAVIAVTPRLGPPLARSTRAALRELRVTHLKVKPLSRWTWYHLMNKPVAIAAAERAVSTPLIAFLDSDTLVLEDPDELLLGEDEDFAACAPDDGVVGTTGPSSPHDPYWREICDAVDLNLDELPWISTCAQSKRIRLYWNSGVFVYRRSTKFGRIYFDMCQTLLRRHAGFPSNGEHWLEQISLGLAMLKAGLRWRELSHSHNYALGSFVSPPWRIDPADGVRILHYHDAMSSRNWNQLLCALSGERPSVHQWLQSLGPVNSPASHLSRLVSEVLRVERGLWRRRYRSHIRARGAASIQPTAAVVYKP